MIQEKCEQIKFSHGVSILSAAFFGKLSNNKTGAAFAAPVGLLRDLQHGRLEVLVLQAVLFGITGQDQGQSAVAGDVAGGAEAVL